MKAFVQRTASFTAMRAREDLSSDIVEETFVGVGLMILLGWTEEDELRSDLEDAETWILTKIKGLRIFPDKNGKMNLDLETYMEQEKIEGGILWVPQFTLAGTVDSGFRPSFSKAMAPLKARDQFEGFKKKILACEVPYENKFGKFGADMEVTFTNWGPVSLMIER